jgi:redox-sensitive bicupin YhaK (pirin superfamily)
MLTTRLGRDRGHANHGWLDSYHTFSFADYFDPAHHNFRSLRVINDDRIAAGMGFGLHPHRDMEILTHVLSGQIAHKDSMGNGETVNPGEWQYMSAGTGVQHSEFNPSRVNPTHLLQIWIVPDKKGYTPRYEQKPFPANPGQWTLAVSPDGVDGSIAIRQDLRLLTSNFGKGDRLEYAFTPGRAGWLHVATGSLTVNGVSLTAGDAVAIEDEAKIDVTGNEPGEVLLFDLG